MMAPTPQRTLISDTLVGHGGCQDGRADGGGEVVGEAENRVKVSGSLFIIVSWRGGG